MASGITAPPGVSLVESQTWFDNAVTITNSGGSFTANGPVTFNSAVNLGTAPANDLSSAVSPSSAGLLAWDFPYVLAGGTGSAVTTAGLLYLAKVPLVGGTVVTNIWFKIATAAASLTTAQNFAGLYNASGQRVAVTGDLTATIGTNTGPIQGALTAPYTVPAGGGNYWVGLIFNASVTQPVLSCYTGQVTVTTSVANFGSASTFGNTAAKYPFAASATTGNTTLPTSITMSSNTATGAYAFWAAVN